MTNEELRQEFEKLPEVAKRLDGTYWNAELNIYQTEYPILFNAVGFINGAWYVYQEQHEKYTKIIEAVTRLQDGFDKTRYMIDNAAWTARQIDVREAILKQLQDLGVPLISENVKIHLDEQDSNHD